jgi:hypothetical protein
MRPPGDRAERDPDPAQVSGRFHREERVLLGRRVEDSIDDRGESHLAERDVGAPPERAEGPFEERDELGRGEAPAARPHQNDVGSHSFRMRAAPCASMDRPIAANDWVPLRGTCLARCRCVQDLETRVETRVRRIDA